MSAAAIGSAGPRRARRPIIPLYSPKPTALHSARATVALGFCMALALPALLFEHPLVLGATCAAVLLAGVAARCGRELAGAARLAVPLALLVVAINPLVSQQGNTLLVRGGEVLGRRFDVTLEALVYGGFAGLRVFAVLMAFALASACVDQDELLRAVRRISYRSALTASLAVRLTPLLARDALRMGDAARCRAEPAGRVAVARASLGGALDRAVDAAAALEVRGYSRAGRPARVRTPWSRHDIAVACGALLLTALAVGARLGGVASFSAYPTLSIELGAAEAVTCAGFLALAVAPLAGARARLGVRAGVARA